MKVLIITLHCYYTDYTAKTLFKIKALFWWEKFQRVREKKAANDEGKSVWTLCLKGTPTKGKLHSSPDGLRNPVLYFYL